MIGKIVICVATIFFLSSSIQANVLRCYLTDPQSSEAEPCWFQLLQKNPMQEIEENPIRVHSRNAEISSALMGLFKANGKRNPDIPRELLQLIGDIRPYKEN